MNPSTSNRSARPVSRPPVVAAPPGPPVDEESRHRSRQVTAPRPRRRTTRWHVATVLACAALGLAGGLLLPGLLPSGYQATTSVLIHPLEGNPYSPSTQGSDLVNLETEAQVAGSDAVIAAVEQQLADGTDRTELTSGLRVAVGANTQVLDITYRAADPAQAAEVAQLVAATYLQHRSDQRDAFVEGRQSALDVRIGDLERRLADLRTAGVSNLDPEVKALGGQLLNLRLQSSGTAAADGSPGQELVAAQASRHGVRVPVWLAVTAGLVAGLVAGLAIAVARERRSDLVRSVEDVELLGLAVLTEETQRAADDDGRPAGLAASACARVVRRQVDAPRTVAVAGLAGCDTDGRQALGLAAVLSRTGEPTLLIDGHDQDTGDEGMSEVLLGGRPLTAVVGSTAEVTMLGPGRQPDRAAALFATSRMTRLLDDAVDAYTWVVVDAPPAGGSQGRALVSSCRYWLPLVVAGRTTRADVTRALAWAESAGVTVLGCVLVAPAPRHGAPAAGGAPTGD